MSVTILAPTPALPPVRRPSMWEKMFGNFKMGKTEESEVELASSSPDSPRFSKTRLASVSTGVDTARISYKRNASVVATETRSCSAPLPQSPSPSKTKARTASIASFKSRRSSRSRQGSWWRSGNSATDDIPAVPAIDRKFSIFGSHNPDVDSEDKVTSSPPTSRRPSYVPRNAASSFLRTTTPLSSEEKVEEIRRASVVDSRSANTSSVSKAPARSHRPMPLFINAANNDSTASHSMYSMAGVCEIEESRGSELVSPRDGAFSIASAPPSPTDTIMEVETGIIDSAKPSPDLLPVKVSSHVAVVHLMA